MRDPRLPSTTNCEAAAASSPIGRWVGLVAVRAALAGTLWPIVAPLPAAAQNATWLANPGSGNFNTDANWNPAAVPTGIATFDASSITSLTFSANTDVGTMMFNSGAPEYRFTNNGFTVQFTGSGIVNNSSNRPTLVNNDFMINFLNSSSAGNANITNATVVTFRNSSTAADANITNNARMFFFDSATAGNAVIANDGGSNLGNFLEFRDSSSAGQATIVNNQTLDFGGSTTAANATLINNRNLNFFGTTTAANSTIITNSGGRTFFVQSATGGSARVITNAGGTFDLSDMATEGLTVGSIEGAGTYFLGSRRFDVGRNNLSSEVSGTIRDTGGLVNGVGGSLIKSGAGTLMLTGNNTYSGGTNLNGGAILAAADSNLGAATGGLTFDGGTLRFGSSFNLAATRAITLNAGGGTFDTNGFDTTIAQAIAGAGGLTKAGTGTLALTGASTYTGATNVDGGILNVNGSLVSAVTLNNGSTLMGTGTVGNVNVGGGTLAPGNSIGTITVAGNLVMTAASTYQVELSPTAADRANVTGTATVGGTVQAVFQPGTYAARSYTILSATGGRGASTFDTLTTNLPGFTADLSYTTTDVLLNLTAQLGTGTPLNGNQANVATSINNFFNSGGTLPPQFTTLFSLSGASLGNALTQLSGEVATGFQSASQLSMNLFLNAMLDPFVAGRRRSVGAAMAYAPEQRPRKPSAQDAFAAAMPVKAAPRTEAFDNRWSVWGSAYGGRTRLDGDPVAGSGDLSESTGGFVAGVDYRVSPEVTIGAAVTIGEARWSVANAGGGDSNLAQVGGYASAQWNALYLSAALAGAWHNISTQRTMNVAGLDVLEADYDATVFGARVEGGWRFELGRFGLTPHAAMQVQRAHLPAYSERATAGSSAFALTYASQNVTDTRSELGVWTDTERRLASGAVVVLRARAAWVHDFDPESRVNAVFQSLPGAGFSVEGAAAPRDAALGTAVGELWLTNGVSLIAKVEGELSNRSSSYTGTGTVRYRW